MGPAASPRLLLPLLGALLLLGAVACTKARKDGEGAGVAGPAGRWYKLELATDTSVTPAFVRLPDAPHTAGVVRLGAREQPVAITWSGPAFEIRFGAMPSRLEGTRSGDGLVGTWGARSATFDGATTFRATRSAGPERDQLFDLEGAPAIARPSVWRLTMPDGSAAEMRLEPRDAAGRVQGYWLYARGDGAELLGEARGNQIALGGFDGVHAYLLLAELQPGGAVTGTWQVVYAGVRTVTEVFTGQPGSLARGIGPAVPEARRPLSIPNVDLARFAGHPTIIELAGSWCPTCRDMAPVWRRINDTYASAGLKLVTLSYEFTDDPAHNQAAAAAFKAEYGMNWEVIPMGGDLDDIAASFPSEYGDLCFPVAFFVDRAGLVQAAKCGFAPDGPNGAELTADLEAEVRRLLAP